MWKRLGKKIIEKVKGFFRYIWSECKDWHTVALLALVVAVVYSPVWVGYLLWFLFKWKWCLAAATTVAAFWAGPFTPFFPLCITVTFALKKLIRTILKIRAKEEGPEDAAKKENAAAAKRRSAKKRSRRERKLLTAKSRAALTKAPKPKARRARAVQRKRRVKRPALPCVPPLIHPVECEGSEA